MQSLFVVSFENSSHVGYLGNFSAVLCHQLQTTKNFQNESRSSGGPYKAAKRTPTRTEIAGHDSFWTFIGGCRTRQNRFDNNAADQSIAYINIFATNVLKILLLCSAWLRQIFVPVSQKSSSWDVIFSKLFQRQSHAWHVFFFNSAKDQCLSFVPRLSLSRDCMLQFKKATSPWLFYQSSLSTCPLASQVFIFVFPYIEVDWQSWFM